MAFHSFLPAINMNHYETVPMPANPRYAMKPYGTKGQWGILDRLTFSWKEVLNNKQECDAIFCGYRSEEMPRGKEGPYCPNLPFFPVSVDELIKANEANKAEAEYQRRKAADSRQRELDAIAKARCLLGYLEWFQSTRPPVFLRSDEIQAVCDEANLWLSEIEKRADFPNTDDDHLPSGGLPEVAGGNRT